MNNQLQHNWQILKISYDISESVKMDIRLRTIGVQKSDYVDYDIIYTETGKEAINIGQLSYDSDSKRYKYRHNNGLFTCDQSIDTLLKLIENARGIINNRLAEQEIKIETTIKEDGQGEESMNYCYKHLSMLTIEELKHLRIMCWERKIINTKEADNSSYELDDIIEGIDKVLYDMESSKE